MTKMTTKVKTQKSEKAWFFLGALAVFFMGVPYLVLGKDSVFVYHDQLDGEVIAYLLQARHLWDGSGVLPEFMNGAAKTALTMPAPACVLLYRWLPAELALAEAVEAAYDDTGHALSHGDYVDVLAHLARLRPQVDAFFDAVMVNAEDPTIRANRLALLQRLAQRLGSVAAIELLSA